MERPSTTVMSRRYLSDDEIAARCASIVAEMAKTSVPWMYSDQLPYDDPGNQCIRDCFLFLGMPYPVILRGARMRMQGKYNTKSAFPGVVLSRFARMRKLTVIGMEDPDAERLHNAETKLCKRYCIRDIRGRLNYFVLVNGEEIDRESLSTDKIEAIRAMYKMRAKLEEYQQ